MISSAEISEDGLYRYSLRRQWDPSLPRLVFVMLNPSTADAMKDDPTIRKCFGFSKFTSLALFGEEREKRLPPFEVGSIVVVNLFAFRSRDPKMLKQCREPVGPENDAWIKRETSNPADTVIAAWGANGDYYPERVRAVVKLVGRPMCCLAVTKSGQPAHPLMLSYGCAPMPWEMP